MLSVAQQANLQSGKQSKRTKIKNELDRRVDRQTDMIWEHTEELAVLELILGFVISGILDKLVVENN